MRKLTRKIARNATRQFLRGNRRPVEILETAGVDVEPHIGKPIFDPVTKETIRHQGSLHRRAQKYIRQGR